jgi:signal transduction histidine kinase
VQVLANLLGNAIKFTEPGGRVTVRAESAPNGVVFSVKDDGPGIPAPDQPRIFERFWHAKQGRADRQVARGSGLGLAIAKGIVDAHAGRVWVESVEGQGSVFKVAIPLADAPAVSHRPGVTDARRLATDRRDSPNDAPPRTR